MKPKRYPGSKPFTLAEKGLFFGREKDIEGLYNFICVEKLSVLYGKSGLGKTSLLNAGVIPKLQEEQNFQIIQVRFGSYYAGCNKPVPLENFEEQIEVDHPDSFMNKVEPDDISLWQHLKNRELLNPEQGTNLIIIDQFEELFTYPKGIEAFAEEIAKLQSGRMPTSFRRKLREKMESHPEWFTDDQWDFIKRPLRIKILLSIRSDKMGLLNRLAPYIPNILRDCYELLPLSREQAESAIVKPAIADGDFASSCFSYETTSLNKILDYLTQNNEKPVESFQLQILCQYVEENLVIKKEDTSISPDDLGNLENIYQNYYDHHITRLGTPEEEHSARILIEEGLIFEKEERRLTLYEGQIYSVYQINKDLLQRLVDTHIIRAIPDSSGGFSYEISHDTLVSPILKSKEKRMRREQEAEERRQMEAEEQKRKEQEAKQQRRFLIRAGITAISFAGLFAIIAYLASINQAAESAKIKAEKSARSGELIIRSLQLQDDATVALRLAQKAYELADGKNSAILDIIGEYYTNTTFYKETYNHRLGVGAVAFAPDGEYILTGSDDNTARLWDLAGKEIECFRGHTGGIKSIAISAKGDLVLSGSADQTAKLWKRSNGQLLQTFEGHTGPIYAVAFSPTSDTILTASRDQTARLWTKDGKEIRKFEGHKDMVLAAIYSPDGEKVYTASHDGMVKSWNIANNGGRTFQLTNVPINCLALSSKGDFILGGTNDGRIIQWKTNGSKLDEFKPHNSDVSFVTLSPTGDSILSGSQEKGVLLWKISNQNGQKSILELARLNGHTDFTRSGVFSQNGQYVITSSNDHTAKVWNVRHEDIRHSQLPDFKPGSIVRFSPEGNQLFIGDSDGNIQWLGFANGDTLHFPKGHNKAITDIKCSSKGNFIATASEDRTAILWQMSQGSVRKLKTFSRHTGSLTSVDILVGRMGEKKVPQTYLLTASEDSTAILWSEKAEPLLTLRGHQNIIRVVAFSPDGQHLLTAGDDRSARIWTFEGEEEHRLVGHSRPILDARFSENSEMVLTASMDKSARLWDVKNGLERVALKGHEGAVTQVAFSPDSLQGNIFLLSGSEDGTARQWSINGREMKRVNVHQVPLLDVSFSTKGSYLFTVDQNGWLQTSFALLQSLKDGDIDHLSFVQLNQYELRNDTNSNRIPYDSLSNEDIRTYAYWYLQKTDKTFNRDRLNYLQASIDIFRNLKQKPRKKNIKIQDNYEMALIFAQMMETRLYLNEDDLLPQLKNLNDSIKIYSRELDAATLKELNKKIIPFVYSANLLKDSTQAKVIYDSLFRDNSRLLTQVQEKMWLMRSLEKIANRFKAEYPGINVTALDNAQIMINENLIPDEEIVAENPQPNARITEKQLTEEEKQKYKEAGNYFKSAAIQSSNNREKELYFKYALQLYSQLPYRERVGEIFDIYKELGYVYTKSSEVDPLLDATLQKKEHNAYASKKGFILTDLSLFNAYMQTTQPEKARSLISKYPQQLIEDMIPAITKYMNFWSENGGTTTPFKRELDAMVGEK